VTRHPDQSASATTLLAPASIAPVAAHVAARCIQNRMPRHISASTIKRETVSRILILGPGAAKLLARG
jgi:hypothetical protein